MRLEEGIKEASLAWQKVYESMCALKNDHSVELTIELSGAYVINDVSNLRYFLAVAGRLRDEGIVSHSRKITLRITSGNQTHDEIKSRIQCFLGFMLHTECIAIKVDNETVAISGNRWEWSIIFPVFEATVDGGDHSINYHHLNMCLYDQAQKKNSDYYGSITHIGNILLKKLQSQKLYEGIPGSPVRATQKTELCDTLNAYLQSCLGEMSILAQIVWLSFLVVMLEDKQLIDLDKISIRESIMNKTRMDAESYAEGMYQTIENACLHSTGKRAWFGFRIHRARRYAPMSEIKDEAARRQFLSEKYVSCFENSRSIFQERDKDYGYYFEFYVLDLAAGGVGITSTFNSQLDKSMKKADYPDIRSIVERKCAPVNPEDPQEHVGDVVEHYGLRLLQRIVSANGGYLQGMSPNGNVTQFYFDKMAKNDNVDKTVVEFTEWNVILPVLFFWNNEVEDNKAVEGTGYCFGDSVQKAPDELVYIDGCDIMAGVMDLTGDKANRIRKVAENIKWYFGDVNRNNRIYLLCPEPDISSLEIFAKGLFAVISLLSCDRQEETSLRIALLMPGMNTIHEFIRYYSAFYFDGKQPDMKGVQLALCMKSTLYEETCTVQFVLEGETLGDAYKIAQQFAYHQPEDAAEHLPMLRYLLVGSTDEKINDRRKNPVFPFDLYLPQALPAKSGTIRPGYKPGMETWFIRRIRRILEADLRKKEYGCCLDDIHIRLGSKIHINRFYEAEMLFHDTGNVARFAYLIAQELIYGVRTPLEQGKNVLLIGNGKYSTSLILQIQNWLEAEGKYGSIFSAVVYDKNEEAEITVRRYFQEKKLADSPKSVTQVVTILPVGTTLSTVYKMLNAVKKNLASVLEFQEMEIRGWNYCLILVTNIPIHNSTVTKDYWDAVDPTAQVVTVKQEVKDSPGDRPTEVNYLIPMEADWYDPENCPLCKKRGKEIRPLIRGRHSNTVPASIFSLLPGQYSQGKLNIASQNRERIKGLYHNIHYSHLYSANNHFQFYIDHQDFYEQNRDEINEWLSKCTVDRNAYHVLISPLQITNSGFLKAVVDYVFEGCVSLVRFDIKDIYREEFRSKFSHVTESYKRVKKENPDTDFFVHFADTSIVTGSSLNRVRLLMNMIISQSQISDSNVSYFNKIFLLVNRCHFETINSFVEDPRKDLYAYVNLRIPSYNTENDFCPACKLRDKYALLGKRSSTQILWDEFSRLTEKHTKRERDEYQDWKHNRLRSSTSDFASLVQYLWLCVPDNDGVNGDILIPFSYTYAEASAYYKKMPGSCSGNIMNKARRVKETIRNYFRDCFPEIRLEKKEDLQPYFRRVRSACLEDVIRYAMRNRDNSGSSHADFADVAMEVMNDLVIGVRDYMRLISMDEAYEILAELAEAPAADGRVSQEDDIRDRRDAMLKMIAQKCRSVKELEKDYADLKKLINTADREEFAVSYSVEWIISYVKVLSREQLASYYSNRCAVSGVMSDMYSLVSGALNETDRKKKIEKLKKENKSWERIVNVLKAVCGWETKNDSAFKIAYQYQLHMTLLHRMSDQQIDTCADGDEIYRTVKLYYGLCDRYFKWEGTTKRDNLHVVLPTVDQMILRYLKSLKLASMVSNDMIPGLKLINAPGILMKRAEGESGDTRKTLILLARYIYLENTQVLYQGIQNLNKRVREDEMHEECEQNPSAGFKDSFYNLRLKVRSHLEKCYKNLDGEGKQVDILKQNILGNFCTFWHRSMECAPISLADDYAPLNQITGMLMYYRSLDGLSDEMHSRKQENIPYYYEELCRCMCMITGFEMCYIAYDEDGSNSEIFTQSGYQVDMFLHGSLLDADRLKDVLYRAREGWRREYQYQNRQENIDIDGKQCFVLTPNIAVLRGGYESDCLVLRMQADCADSYETGFYVIFQSKLESENVDDTKFKKSMLQRARNILMMREKLQKVLSRDYAVLKGFRFDCSYVRQMSEKDIQGGPSALHLSDLHVCSDVTELIKVARNTIKYNLKNQDVSQIDLLVVSGDIIDSHDASASRIEQNYKYAEIFLKNVAVDLWKDDDGYLPHDWKKRVLITTGNHDYASMNQYHAVQKHRLLTAAMPSEADSDTMAKFAYYIEFMMRFLDRPIDELLRSDLNEVRYYRRMNLKAIVLNCSGKATVQRTNKIGVNQDKLEPLLRQERWRAGTVTAWEDEPIRLCVAHYSPEYNLSYFMDSYSETIPGWEWNPEKSGICKMNILVNLFCELMHMEVSNLLMQEKRSQDGNNAGNIKGDSETELERRRKEFLDFMEQLDRTLQAMKKGTDINSVNGDKVQELYDAMMQYPAPGVPELNQKKGTVKKMQKCELYRQMVQYRDWLHGDCDTSDEQMIGVMYQIAQSLKMSESDKTEFEELIKYIVNSWEGNDSSTDKKIDLYLAGHVHSYAESTSSSYIKNILVADKLYYNGNRGINGYIIPCMRADDNRRGKFRGIKLEEPPDKSVK